MVGTRYGNIIGDSITINKQLLERVSSKHAASLTRFIELKYNIPPEQAKPIQNSLYQFTKAEGINPDEKVSTVKQKNINSKFSIFSKKAIEVLAKTAETVTAFRRLTRFSKLTGKKEHGSNICNSN